VKETVKLAAVLGVIASCCVGLGVVKPDLAQALRASDPIVVARVISGQAQSTSSGASSDLILRIVRVLKGEISADHR